MNDLVETIKNVPLFSGLPREDIAKILGKLEEKSFAAGATVFSQGEKGDSFYIVQSGAVQVVLQSAGGRSEVISVLGPQDCFGEMALVEEVARTARAAALGKTALFRLHREDMDRWLKSHPELAVDFFAELVQVLSRRLRLTSSESTLIFDLSNLLLEPLSTGNELLSRVLAHVVPHLAGSWSAAAYLYNAFNDEMDFVAGCGPFDFSRLSAQLPAPTETRSLWIADQTYYVSLPGQKRPHGYLIFRCESALAEQDRAEAARTLTTVAHLLVSALENIYFRTDAKLRERLKNQTTHGAYF